ncbi:glycosyltransferase [Pseudoalteromonas sp. J010]|uniref:glycosyltransferase family 2 protein n=1 Tax=Pseudoalteromonas sp. J010 TaxID=998465 RepID=UPI000F650FCD|nr:glycosyltransferase [Pseudoalteromonas sp. J010]RRS10099.1 glycosyltransferase [Pseudoalteromonas sp. J010]
MISTQKVVIGIPTYKRPQGLLKLLDSVTQLNIFGLDVTVVVAENDCDELAGAKLVDAIKNEYALPLKVLRVEKRGISFVRNALLDCAFTEHQADYLAMVDDDEWVEPNWLQALVKAQQKLGCEVIGGVAKAEFAQEVPDWATELSIYFPEQANTTSEIELLESTASVLLHKQVYCAFDQHRFDPFYSIYGGGDKEYFTRLKASGVKFAVAHEAISHELYSDSRATKAWATERAFRIGAADMRIILLHHKHLARISIECIKIVLGGVVGLAYFYLPFVSASKKMKGRLLYIRQVGKISGLFNQQRPVYKKTHGK